MLTDDVMDGSAEWIGTGYSFRRVLRSDVAYVAHNMREIDIREVLLLKGMPPYEGLSDCVANARWSMTMAIGQGFSAEPIAIFGVTPATVMGQIGRPWLLGTDGFGRKNARPIVESTRTMVDLMHAEFPVLQNWAHVDNTLALRWLQWAGFSLGEETLFEGERFVEFRSVVDARVCLPALNETATMAEMI